MTDRSFLDGYVVIDPDEVLRLIHTKRASLREQEALDHSRGVDRVLKRQTRPRRYILMPWRTWRATCTREQAKRLYEATSDDPFFTEREWTLLHYRRQRLRLDDLEAAALGTNRAMYLSVKTTAWLREANG